MDADYVLGAVFKAASAVGNTSVPLVESGWEYMTDNYSKFTISMVFSVILHEVNNGPIY